mmetsp:Transcript_9114/g.22319  ORF Transcript_9114/g.22319 Transcript_9114/m.22319 type:complete len:746 (+) Transcript_9114:395-2632(+)|eukprot:CAMPEP_0178991154 /NCGR_PEP_ID=MMETSP0795-20121207/5362_1 /TAXON_ID=88552 /ORGANISM="Amoebophrya sp., Strain Ameob2" /LENGTH=745 /DNA_ID=CAMNT_0020682815 /DNA_START=361 /DNA_END=2598 /DNA_ORIENTATION=-
MLSWLRASAAGHSREDGEWERPELSDDSDWEQIDDDSPDDLSADVDHLDLFSFREYYSVGRDDDEMRTRSPSALVKGVTGLLLTMVASYFVVIVLSLGVLFHAYVQSFFLGGTSSSATAAPSSSTALVVMPQKALSVVETGGSGAAGLLFSTLAPFATCGAKTTSSLATRANEMNNFTFADLFSAAPKKSSSDVVLRVQGRSLRQERTQEPAVFYGPQQQQAEVLAQSFSRTLPAARNVSFIQRDWARALNVRALVKGLLLRVRNKTESRMEDFPLVPVPQVPAPATPDFDFLDFKLQHAMLDAYVSKITRPFHSHSLYSSFHGSRSSLRRGGNAESDAACSSRKTNEKKARSNRSKHFQRIDNLPAALTANPFKKWEEQQVTFSQFLATISEEWGGFPLKRQFLATISEADWTGAFSGPLANKGTNATRDRAMVLSANNLAPRRMIPRPYRVIPSRRVIIPFYEAPSVPLRQPVVSRPSRQIVTPDLTRSREMAQNEPKTFLFVEVKSKDYPYLLSGFSVKRQECANFTLLVGEYTHTVISGLVGIEDDLAAFVENFRSMISSDSKSKRPLAIDSSDDFKAVSPWVAQNSWQTCPASVAKFMEDLNVRMKGKISARKSSRKCSRKVDFVASNSTVVMQVSTAEPTRNLAKARAAYRALKKEAQQKEAEDKARKAMITFPGAPRLVPKYADVARVWKYAQLVAEPRVDASKQVVPLEFFGRGTGGLASGQTCPLKACGGERKMAV